MRSLVSTARSWGSNSRPRLTKPYDSTFSRYWSVALGPSRWPAAIKPAPVMTKRARRPSIVVPIKPGAPFGLQLPRTPAGIVGKHAVEPFLELPDLLDIPPVGRIEQPRRQFCRDVWSSALNVDGRALFVNLLIFMAIEAQFAGRIKAAVAVIAFPQHSNRVGEARAVVKRLARSVVSFFADQHGASGSSAEREICHHKNNLLRAISFQIHPGRGGRRQHYLMKLWTSTPVPIPQHLRQAAPLPTAQRSRKVNLPCRAGARPQNKQDQKGRRCSLEKLATHTGHRRTCGGEFRREGRSHQELRLRSKSRCLAERPGTPAFQPLLPGGRRRLDLHG